MEPRSDPLMNTIFGDRIAPGEFTHGLIVDGYPATKDHTDYLRKLVVEGRLPNPIVAGGLKFADSSGACLSYRFPTSPVIYSCCQAEGKLLKSSSPTFHLAC